jgi:hypothetical protein
VFDQFSFVLAAFLIAAWCSEQTLLLPWVRLLVK